MTDQEEQELRKRLEKAAVARGVAQRYREAIDKLTDGSVVYLAVRVRPMNESESGRPAVMYQKEADEVSQRWPSVCWAKSELGLVDELREAIAAVLHKRLAAAEDELAKA